MENGGVECGSPQRPHGGSAGEAWSIGTRVRVCPGDPDGWELRLEIGDRLVARWHYTDWHRVERRRAELEAECGRGALAMEPSIA